MPGPVALAPTDVFHLNVWVPTDLLARLRGTRVSLPVNGADVSVKIGDQVIVSLRTKDPKDARSRFKRALAALDAHFKAVRVGPKPLTLKQTVALAGEAYRDMVLPHEDEPGDFERAERAHEEAIAGWRFGEPSEADEDGTQTAIALGDATFFAELQLTFGSQLLTLRHGGDLHNDYV